MADERLRAPSCFAALARLMAVEERALDQATPAQAASHSRRIARPTGKHPLEK